MKTLPCVIFTVLIFGAPAFAAVTVSSPSNGGTVSSPVNYSATATTNTCSKGVASIGVYANNQLAYVANGATLNTQVKLGAGAQNTVVEEWDNCGGASYTTVNVTVQGSGPSGSGGNVLSNLQASGGWSEYGELAPAYSICSSSSSCPGVNWSMSQHVSSPSLSGNATKLTIGGNTPYSDVLWTDALIGQNSTQNLADSDHTLLPTLHNFTYDAYVYVTNYSITQDLEFDINMYMNGVGMLWGTQCNHLADGDWDIWDDASARWVSSGVACNLVNNSWNHVTVQAQRESNNTLLYQSITVNGATSNINQTSAPFSVPGSWWGITINYQMDGNYNQSANTTYLDNLSFTYQ